MPCFKYRRLGLGLKAGPCVTALTPLWWPCAGRLLRASCAWQRGQRLVLAQALVDAVAIGFDNQ